MPIAQRVLMDVWKGKAESATKVFDRLDFPETYNYSMPVMANFIEKIAFHHFGFSRREWIVFATAHILEVSTFRELKRIASLPDVYFDKEVAKLEHRGLIQTTEDLKKQLITITPKGRDIMNQFHALYKEMRDYQYARKLERERKDLNKKTRKKRK